MQMQAVGGDELKKIAHPPPDYLNSLIKKNLKSLKCLSMPLKL